LESASYEKTTTSKFLKEELLKAKIYLNSLKDPKKVSKKDGADEKELSRMEEEDMEEKKETVEQTEIQLSKPKITTNFILAFKLQILFCRITCHLLLLMSSQSLSRTYW